MATPRASPTLRAEATFLPKKRSSSAIALGSCQRISSPRESWSRASRRSTERSEGVSITPPSRATMRSPDVRTTPNPVLAVPGSIPMTITLFHSHSPLGCPSTIRERDPGDWEKKGRVTARPGSRIAAMRAGEKARFRSVGAIAIAVLVGLLALGVASPAVAKKKKKKSQPVVSATASAPFNAASGQTLAATCGKGAHISGGGFAVDPNYVPGSGLTGTGLRSGTGTSTPDGAKTWKVASSSWANPAASGTLTAIARCESDSLGKLFATLSSSLSLSPGEGTPRVLNCPNGTHVIAGGYAGDAAGTPAYTAPSFRLIMLQ